MALELRQQLKLSQQLVMTPQLQQAIRLLQLSRLELVETVQRELLENPFLEEMQDEQYRKRYGGKTCTGRSAFPPGGFGALHYYSGNF